MDILIHLFVGLHIIVFALVVFIFWLRARNRPLITRAMFSRASQRS